MTKWLVHELKSSDGRFTILRHAHRQVPWQLAWVSDGCNRTQNFITLSEAKRFAAKLATRPGPGR